VRFKVNLRRQQVRTLSNARQRGCEYLGAPGLRVPCGRASNTSFHARPREPTRSYLAHLTAVSFFPTILAGPITRVSSLIEQFEKRKPLDPADGGRALFLIGVGLTKKLLVADYLAGNLVNRVFDFPTLYTGAETLVAVYAYAIQLYYDFSGYTDIALGSALPRECLHQMPQVRASEQNPRHRAQSD
jgi:D-alanyl-lipoteichoic acid acyltransferase DltB (MBOAT superfamily)